MEDQMTRPSPIPTEHPPLIPYLAVPDARAAIAFYAESFGAVEAFRLVGPDGRVGHAEVTLGPSLLMLSDAYPEIGVDAPAAPEPGSTPRRSAMLTLYVEDVDATVARAEGLGATVLRPAADQFYGDRTAQILDPFGHVWSLQTRIEDVSPAEMQRRWDAMDEG